MTSVVQVLKMEVRHHAVVSDQRETNNDHYRFDKFHSLHS